MSSCSNNLRRKCKQRFKGVESFLRRVAFNLGNTPSQTEVKIISCIPIDVTDLQQKILFLEKELEASKTKESSSLDPPDESSVIQTALCKGFSRQASACKPEPCPATQVERCEGFDPPPCRPPPALSCAAKPTNCMCWSSDASCPDDQGQCPPDSKKGLFKKQKKKKEKPKKKEKGKTQFVYYAQTTNGPFSNYLDDKANVTETPAGAESMSRAYISEMIRKQYTPVPLVQDPRVGSEFSSPVCRDAAPSCMAAGTHDSDVCSCCYGPFHNIDQHMPRPSIGAAPSALPTCDVNDRVMRNTGFYDTSLYDMIPVRDKPTNNAKSYHGNTRRKSPSNTVPLHYYPERRRSRIRVHPYAGNHYSRTQIIPHSSRRMPIRIQSRKEKPRRMSPRRINVVERLKPTETSDSCCIDCGNVYVKRIFAGNKPKEVVKPINVATHKNAECLTNSILNDTECQTTTTQSVQIDEGLLEEKKTEETLNQIKTILQTVLTEVKTNTQLKKVPEDKSTKDAVVQKGMSQGNMPGCSTLLHSYTYSPYNMNPYLASCSRQMPSGPCCFPNMPYTTGKCMHNYPVFIQTPPRHMCASCFRNSSHIPKPSQVRQATTAATNTDSKTRSKETEKLIKEIYKSMTVNMDFPAKETSASEYNERKSTPRGSLNKSLYRASVLDAGMRNFVKANESKNVKKLASPLSTLDGKIMSHTMSMRSQIVSTTDTERRLRNHRLESYLASVDAQKRQRRIVEEREYEEPTPETTASDDDASSSDANERVVYTSAKEPTKKTESIQKSEPIKVGLFSKMLKSVKLFSTKTKKKEEQIQVDNDEDEESENSDDYQTVYSQRVERTPRHIPYPVRAVRSPPRIKAHSKISYSRQMRDRNQERSRRGTPYMEQEYRRHWNERLMFHENHRYSSDSPHSKDNPRTPVYWQNYEARSALVGRAPINRKSVSPHIVRKLVRPESPRPDSPTDHKANKGLAWLKKHKLGINCGPQWKKLILEG